jgi:hypothetical protein
MEQKVKDALAAHRARVAGRGYRPASGSLFDIPSNNSAHHTPIGEGAGVVASDDDTQISPPMSVDEFIDKHLKPLIK